MTDIVTFDLDRARHRIAEGGGKRFWSSVEELLDDNYFRDLLAAEFPSAAEIISDPQRRQLLKLMGASLLLAGLTGCGQSRSEQALPYVSQPEDLLPGVPRYYATAVMFEGYAQPVIATTYDGRPTKLDGNPEHPVTRGKSDSFMQAAVLGLYDPERARQPAKDRVPATWALFQRELSDMRGRWAKNHGAGLRLVMGRTTSPTLARQVRALLTQYPQAGLHIFDAVGAMRHDESTAAIFGRALERHYALDACDVIVSLDDDIVGPGPQQVRNAMNWAAKRGEQAPGAGRGRLHVAESVPGLAGTVASTRLACDPSRMRAIAQALAATLGVEGQSAPQLAQREQAWVERAAAELRGHAGHSLLTAGAQLDPDVQALAVRVNQALGNIGKTVAYSEPVHARFANAQPMQALADDIAAGKVETLIALDSNFVYAGAASLKFDDLLPRVPERIQAGLYSDETAALCQWQLPLSHALESWSDARAVDGTATIIQPMVAPLYGTPSIHQVMDMLLGTVDPLADAAVQATWRESFGADFDKRWRQSLHDGFVGETAAPFVTVSVANAVPVAQAEPAGEVEIVFRPDPTIWDGRFANIAWLQELPKPLTKVTWDNVVALSPALATEKGLSNGDAVEVMIGERKVSGPAWILPGQARKTVALYFGYGRRHGGEISKDVGYDAFAIRPADAWHAAGSIRRAGDAMSVATTQMHHRMDGFDFVREVTAKSPHTPPPKDQSSLYAQWPETENAWGMVIDLDLCIGCNACVSACNVENNVPVVGKDQVSRGREMAWLRIDRYYTGDPEEPRSYFQPVPCMHCEQAPCEMGCPVHATVHSPEGVNQMVFNRCIGTRTCSSYCPYKVRRFNWYDYRKFDEADRAAKNPDVTVRSRGVMEKCSYCTQRIQAAHVAADKENRGIRDGDVVTACQQACPTKAISFGNLKDEKSIVAERRRSGRHYVLLEELGTRPRTTYLARWNDETDSGEGAS